MIRTSSTKRRRLPNVGVHGCSGNQSAPIVLRPDNAQAYNALGYSYADRNINLSEARDLIEKALPADAGRSLHSG